MNISSQNHRLLSLTDQFGVLKYIVFISIFSKFEISDKHHQRAC